MFKRVSMVQISYHLGGKIESNPSIQPIGNFPNIMQFLQTITKVQIIGNVTCKYSTMKYGHIGLIEKITQKYKMQHDAGVEQQVEFSLPANVNFTFFRTKQNGDFIHGVNLFLEPKLNKKEPVARMITEPFTTFQQLKDITPLAKSKNKMMVNIREAQNVTFPWGPSKALLVNISTQQEFVDYAEAQRSKKDSDFLSILFFPFASSAIQYSQFNVSIDQTKLQQLKLQFNTTRQSRLPPLPLSQQPSGHGSQSPKHPGNDAHTTIVNLGMTTTGSAEKQAYRAAFNVTASQIRNNDHLHFNYNVTKTRFPALPKLVEELKIDVQGKWAYMPQYFIQFAREYSPNSNISFSMYYNNKTNSNPAMQLNGKCRLERSDERLEYVLESPRYKQCREQVRDGQLILPACLNSTRRIAVLDELSCEARYEHVSSCCCNPPRGGIYSSAHGAAPVNPYHSASHATRARPYRRLP
ncbi:Vitellogenin-1 [Gryllus bimaculatus]|nr:Vitellogenin-1 [Gryllus bimaculatus]